METRARYIVIGAFSVFFILGVFVFIYWLQNSGGLSQRATYVVQFSEPVSGLTNGAGVLFNGKRVGTVTDLTFDSKDPNKLLVTITVEVGTPIHTDTAVDITFQGITGSPAIMLRGGTAAAPLLVAKNGVPPVLVAPLGSGKNLTESARDTLHNLDDILVSNKEPLKTAIAGISTFADMLGRNSERIEGVLGGLEKLTGGGGPKVPPAVYDLVAPTSFPGLAKTLKEQMAVADPTASLVFDTQKILTRAPDGTYSSIENAQWADNLPKLFQAKILQSFENANQLGSVSRASDQAPPGYRLELGLRNFQIATDQQPSALVEFTARLLTDKGDVKDAKIFKASVPAKSTQPAEAVTALNQAFSNAARDLVVWAVGLI